MFDVVNSAFKKRIYTNPQANMKGNKRRPDPGTILLITSAAIAPAAVLYVKKAPAYIERTAYFALLLSNKASFF